MDSRQPWPDNDIRLLYLRELRERLGDFVLIGAHARDLLCNGVAGVSRQMPSTTDLDIAVAIPAVGAEYRDRVAGLDPDASSSAMRFHLPADADVPERTAVPIDVIPYGKGVPDVQNIMLDRDKALDASGIEEAAEDPLHVRVHPTLSISVPRLHAMVGLKLLAYGLRSQFAEYKDARDLAFLFEAMTETDLAREDHYNHVDQLPDDALVDTERAGAWLLGARMRRTMGAELTQRAVTCIDRELPARMVQYGWAGVAAPTSEVFREQLEWLAEGSSAADLDLDPWPP